MADKKITTYDDGTAQEAKSAKLLGVVSGTTKLFDSSDVTDLSAYIQKSNTSGLLKNDGTVDTNTYLTQHQDISGKQDKLVSGTNIKTINNQSLLGSGNITIEGGGSSVQSDWNQTDDTADDYIKNKPTIPDAQIQSDWNQSNTSAKDFIKNKPTIPSKTSDLNNDSDFVTSSDLADVATTGSYDDLFNKPSIYTKQEANDIFLKGESVVVALPEGYEQVSNITTSGEQYINTGYTPNPSTFGFFIDIKTEDPVTSVNAGHLFVAGKRTDNAKYRVALTMYNQTSGGELRIGASTDKNPRLGRNLHATLEVKNKVISYPNGSTNTIATEIEDINCSTSLYLFAINNNGEMQRFATCRLYRFQIYEGSTLVRDFVPARRISDGKLGLYEMLGTYSGETGYFFVNEGSGEDFTVEDTISGLGDFVNNSTLVNDAVYVHTDNNFTNAFKNQINTNATNISNKADTTSVQMGTESSFSGTMVSGKNYVLSSAISSLTVSSVTEDNIRESTITFTVSGSSFDVTLPSGTKIIGDKPTFINGNTYIMSYFNGMVVFGEVNTYVNPA